MPRFRASLCPRAGLPDIAPVGTQLAPARGRGQASIPGSPPIETISSSFYTHLHTHPELSYQEVETSARMAEELKKAGAKVTTGVGKLGVVGVIENGAGPVVLVRPTWTRCR